MKSRDSGALWVDAEKSFGISFGTGDGIVQIE